MQPDDEGVQRDVASAWAGSPSQSKTVLSDGNFQIPRPRQSLAFTGERMTTEREGQVEFEHFHRYCIARDICTGKDVLDVASGEGYGSALLAGVARHVTGLELDADSVAHAKAGYILPNVSFFEGDAHELPFADASFDVVVSFETLEHLRDQRRFLTETKRVLRPGGTLVISTPDRHVYSAPGQPVNPYHVLELAHPEFDSLLGEFFASHCILQQRSMLGSVIVADGRRGGWRSYDRRAANVIEATSGLARSFYLIGIASDGPLDDYGGSVYCDNRSIDDIVAAAVALPTVRETLRIEQERLAAAQSQAVGLLRALDQERRETANVRRAAETHREGLIREVQALQAELSVARRELAETHRGKAILESTLESVRRNPWWRLGGPLRVAARKLRGGRNLPQPVAPVGTDDQLAVPPPRIDMRAELGLPPRRDPLPPASRITMPEYDAPPVVSIVIPTFGQVDHTLRCLASLAVSPPQVPTEVIVVEDASHDPRIEELAEVQGIKLIIRKENLGFLKSCNAAAALVRGKFLMLLNNDTEVMPGAVDALHRLLANRPDAGLAGARLLYPDGWQQEAGGIIWRDGSAWNYGNRDDPRKPEYNYVREADYVSGAAIMLPFAVWEELGGFDEHYAPAYCEDSDLAFRVRDAGLKVLYQPEAQVIHFEGASHGTDLSAGLKSHQTINTRKLYDRWRETLRRSHLPSGTRLMRARDRSVGRKVTLVIDHYVPEPDRDAGSRTMVAFIDALLATGRVVKFFPLGGRPGSSYASALMRRGVEVLDSPLRDTFASWIEANGNEIDEILLSRPHVADACLPAINAHCPAPIVFYGHDLHHLRMRAEPGALDDPRKRLDADEMEAMERRAWCAADVVLYPSDDEARTVRELEPGVTARSVAAYALSTPPAPHAPPPAEAGIIFVAGFAHPPNVDAAIWLVNEILPRLRTARPDLTLALVGSNPSPAVLALRAETVEVTGFVTDDELARRYASARVSVCPLRFGAGVKMKVIEAMHHGVPLVTTPIGAQGLDGLDAVCGVHADAEAFATAVLDLLDNDSQWIAQVQRQSAFVATRFTPDIVRKDLERAFALAREWGHGSGSNAAQNQ
jgi:GT2 family glycosyltransferase/SAM-dependent methyltransferase